MNKEKWEIIDGYEGKYHVSSKGKIIAITRICRNTDNTINNKRIKEWSNKKGYVFVSLIKNGHTKNYRIHRLVAQTFIPNPKNKPQVNHINGIKTDNRVENLEWVTDSENKRHGYRTGLLIPFMPMKGKKGAKCPNSRPVLQMNLAGTPIYIYSSSKEACLVTGVSRLLLSKCLNGKKENALDFKWRYF